MTVTTTTETDDKPRAWVGCLACYNDGALVGHWFDAVDCDEVDLAMVHNGSGRSYGACEEMYVLDHELIPVQREMSLPEAAEWGRLHDEVGSEQWGALCAWVSSGSYVAEGDSDLPVVSDFEERYAGRWESFREYAEDLADQTGLTAGWSETAQSYFNWDSWTRDLAFDYVVVAAPGPDYGVYVFRSL